MQTGFWILPCNFSSLIVQGKREVFPFACRFCLFVSLGLILISSLSRAYFFQPLITMLTELVGLSLGLAGVPIVIYDQRIVLPGIFGIEIAEECAQAEEWMVFLSAVLAYPTSNWSRLVGVALVTTTALLGSTARIVTLFWAGMQGADYFDALHVYLWPVATYFGLVLLWILWLRYFALPCRAWKTFC